jgi:GTP cyclohydrolase IA
LAKTVLKPLVRPDVVHGARIIRDMMQWLRIPQTVSTKETPERVARMYAEIFDGLYRKPPRITTFPGKDGYVAVTDIAFNSVCEHHLLPFIGKCGVVYHSKGRVIGISKIPRIVEYWSARPSIQEDLTMNIAQDIMQRLCPHGVYVVMSARHTCMEIRGVKARGSATNTATVLGTIDKDEAIRLLRSGTFING